MMNEYFIIPKWPAPENIKAIQTTRKGGVSLGKYASLNLTNSTGDEEHHVNANHKELSAQGIGADGNGSVYSIHTSSHLKQGSQFDKPIIVPEDEIIDFTTPPGKQQNMYQYC